MSEVFLDTETTGLSFNDGHKIVEIACIETIDLIPSGKVFHKLINPNRSMPNEAFKVHGFSEEFLKDKEICRQTVKGLLRGSGKVEPGRVEEAPAEDSEEGLQPIPGSIKIKATKNATIPIDFEGKS